MDGGNGRALGLQHTRVWIALVDDATHEKEHSDECQRSPRNEPFSHRRDEDMAGGSMNTK